MPEIPLQAEPRADLGSGESRRLRAAGRVPAVVYGHGADPMAISVDARELRHLLSGASGANTLIDLHVGSQQHLTLAREIQHHPVRQTVSHVDFQVVRRDEVVSAEVRLVLVGDAEEVTRAGGTVEQIVQSIAVRARPGDIPTGIDIDVSGLALGHTLHVRDLPQLRGVSYEADPDTVIVAAPVPHGVTAAEMAEVEGAVEAERAEEAGGRGSSGGAGGASGGDAGSEP
jgi:large subunit ribosomal protein L25